MLKRAFDLVASGLGLLVFSPVLAGVACWIKLDSRGPVFYRGERAGRNGTTFRIYKFRSMVVDADKLGPSSTSDDDRRITRSGQFVRKFKLDELPQLINVFLGQMSLVGPRPQVVSFVKAHEADFKKVLSVRPGITDWASIWNSDEGAILEGARDADEAYTVVIHPIKTRLQEMYVDTHTVPGDIKLILYTIRRILDRNFYPSELNEYPRLRPIAESHPNLCKLLTPCAVAEVENRVRSV